MSSIIEGCYKPRLYVYVSVNLLAGVWQPLARLRLHRRRRRRRRRRARVPTSSTASDDNHENSYSWFPFVFL